MIATLHRRGVLPFRWVLCDEGFVYNPPSWMGWQRRGCGPSPRQRAIPACGSRAHRPWSHPVRGDADALPPARAWRRPPPPPCHPSNGNRPCSRRAARGRWSWTSPGNESWRSATDCLVRRCGSSCGAAEMRTLRSRPTSPACHAPRHLRAPGCRSLAGRARDQGGQE